MKEKFKDYSIRFVKEIIPVIGGILIALFIDNWNSERKDKAYLNQVLATIDKELADSNEDIKAIIPLQKALVDSLDFYAENKEFGVLDIVKNSKGIFIPKVKINAWKSISNAKIDLVDYEKITLLSNIEELKQLLNDKSEFLMSFIYNNMTETDKSKKQTLKIILLDIIQTEKTMQESIESFERK